MGDVAARTIGQPVDWVLCFHDAQTVRPVARLVPGHFKHVSAFALLPQQGWLLYDVVFSRVRRSLIPQHEVDAFAEKWTLGCGVILMRGKPPPPADHRPPSVLCTSSIRAILCIPGGALLPDRLWRDCLRNGGIVIHDGRRDGWDGGRPSEPLVSGGEGAE